MISGLRSTALLVVCCMSLVLFAFQVGADPALTFASGNSLPFATRKVLLACLLGGAAAAGAVGLWLATRGPRVVRALHLAARLVSPLSVAAFVPALCKRGVWEPLPTVAIIGAVVIVFERLVQSALTALDELVGASGAPRSEPAELRHTRFGASGAPRSEPADLRHTRIGAAWVSAGALGYALIISRYTVFAHRRFLTSNFDLGQYDNIFWSALHGYPMRCSPLGAVTNWSEMAGHADLSVYFLLPFYALRPTAETLLIIQSSVIALGAIPIYLFAARRLPALYAALLAFAYLLWPPVHGANFYDFHFQPIAATSVLFTIYFIDAKRRIPAVFFFIMALGCREDTSVGLTMLGTYYLLSGYRPRAGLLIAVVSSIYFVVTRFVIMPHFGPSWFSDIYKELYPRPDGPQTYGGVIMTMLSNPVYTLRTMLTEDKLRYFLQIVTPLAFLPLRRAFLLPALAPGVLFTVMTTAYPPTTDIAFQYSGHFTPYIFTASAVVLASRANSNPRNRQRATVAALCVSALLCALQWGALPPRGSVRGGFQLVTFDAPTPADLQRDRDLRELAAMIPTGAGFAVSEQELPHVSGRLDVYTLRVGIDRSSNYVLYGLGSGGADVAARALSDGSFEQIESRPGLALLKRKQ